MKKYTIDATNKKLGRVASEAATFLMGKNSTEFVRNRAPIVSVEIVNAKKLAITEKKMLTTSFVHFTGYPGGLRSETMKNLSARKGIGEIVRHAVRGMLPSNKLRPDMLKNLIIKE